MRAAKAGLAGEFRGNITKVHVLDLGSGLGKFWASSLWLG